MNYFLKKKKWMAWVVLLTFLFTSFMPSNLLAGNSVAEAATDSATLTAAQNTQKEKQIVKKGGTKYFKAGREASSTDNDVTISKTVSPTGVENEFDIELKVITSENIEELKEIKKEAAVVLVMDASKSMQWDIDGGGYCAFGCETRDEQWKKTKYFANAAGHDENHPGGGGDCVYVNKDDMRITKAVSAAKNFVKSYQETFTDQAMLSIVKFNWGARTIQPWVDLAKEENALANAESAINGLMAYDADADANKKTTAMDTGTNIEAGLQLAYNLLANNKSSLPEKKYIVLLTDGEPNRYSTDQNDTSDTSLEDEDTGSKNKEDSKKRAEAEVSKLKTSTDTSATVYAVGFSKDAGDVTYLKADRSFNATDDIKLAEAFTTITDLITRLAEAWTVTDPMGSESIKLLTSKFDDSGNACTIENGNKLIWDLKNSSQSETNTYTLNYRIRLANTGQTVAEKVYDTNGKTTLEYVVKQNSLTNPEYAYSQSYFVDFAIPQVKGYTGEFNVQKKAFDSGKGNGTNLSGAEFTLHDQCGTHSGNEIQSQEENKSNGKYKFSNIPSGHLYSVEETQAPTGGYDPNSLGNYVFSVEYGTVKYKKLIETETVDDVINALKNKTSSTNDWNTIGTSNSDKVDFENKLYPAITITKCWETNQNGTPGATLELLRNGRSFVLDETKATVEGATVNKSTVDKTYLILAAQSGKENQTITIRLNVPKGTPLPTYTVKEVAVGGANVDADGKATVNGTVWYTAVTGSTSSEGGITVTNTEAGSIEFKKVDERNQALSGATFGLYSDESCSNAVLDTDEKPITATANADGKVTFSNLKPDDYFVKELDNDSDNDGYFTINSTKYKIDDTVYQVTVEAGQTATKLKKRVNGNWESIATSNVSTITNIRVGDITFTKVAADTKAGIANAQFGLYTRASNGEYVKYQNETAISNGNGIVTFENIPYGDYYVHEEAAVGNYLQNTNYYPVTVNNLSNVVNNGQIPNVEKTSVTVKKVWEDDNNRDGIRPDKVTFQVIPVTAGTGAIQSDDWNKLGFTPLVLPAVENTIESGDLVAAVVTLTGNNDEKQWSQTVSGLPKMTLDGNDIAYHVKEVGEASNKYSVTKDGKTYEYTVEYNQSTKTVKNSYQTATTSLTVTKAWNGGDSGNKSINFKLKQNGVVVPDAELTFTITGAQANGYDWKTKQATAQGTLENGVWGSYTFTNLPVYKDNGQPITYSVEEVSTPTVSIAGASYLKDDSGTYTAVVTNADGSKTVSQNGAIKITNTLTGKGDISVTKVWEDSNNQDGKRANIDVQLQQKVDNGAWSDVDKIDYVYVDETNQTNQTVSQRGTQTLATGENHESNLNYTWRNIPLYDEQGNAIAYRVVETKIGSQSVKTVTSDNTTIYKTDDYTVTYGNNEISPSSERRVVTITNTHVPETAKLKVEKIWSGDDGLKELRGNGVTFDIIGKVGTEGTSSLVKKETLSVSATDGWTKTIDLPKYHQGKPITYLISEQVPEGYEVSYKVNDQNAEQVTWTPAGENQSWIGAVLSWLTGEAKTSDIDCTVTATNTLVTRDFELTKDYSGTGSHDQATFTITGSGGQITADQNNKYRFTGLKYGVIYTVTEDAPDGYAAANDFYLKVVKDENDYVVKAYSDTACKTEVTSTSNTNGWTVTNGEYTLMNFVKTADFSFEKEFDSATPDNMPTFTVKRGNKVVTVTLDNGTMQKLENVGPNTGTNKYEFNNLECGTYTVTESNVPGYEAITFTIEVKDDGGEEAVANVIASTVDGEDAASKYTIWTNNERGLVLTNVAKTAELTLEKTYNGVYTGDATFQITENGEEYPMANIGLKDGLYKFSGLQYGKTYTVTEKAPTGYNAVEFDIAVSLTNRDGDPVAIIREVRAENGNVLDDDTLATMLKPLKAGKYQLKNKVKTTGFSFTKAFEGKRNITTPSFVAYQVNDGTVSKEGISFEYSNENGQHRYSITDGLEYGRTYVVVESDTPAGYEPAAPFEITVELDSKNEAYAKVVDITGRTDLAGNETTGYTLTNMLKDAEYEIHYHYQQLDGTYIEDAQRQVDVIDSKVGNKAILLGTSKDVQITTDSVYVFASTDATDDSVVIENVTTSDGEVAKTILNVYFDLRFAVQYHWKDADGNIHDDATVDNATFDLLLDDLVMKSQNQSPDAEVQPDNPWYLFNGQWYAVSVGSTFDFGSVQNLKDTEGTYAWQLNRDQINETNIDKYVQGNVLHLYAMWNAKPVVSNGMINLFKQVEGDIAKATTTTFEFKLTMTIDNEEAKVPEQGPSDTEKDVLNDLSNKMNAAWEDFTGAVDKFKLACAEIVTDAIMPLPEEEVQAEETKATEATSEPVAGEEEPAVEPEASVIEENTDEAVTEAADANDTAVEESASGENATEKSTVEESVASEEAAAEPVADSETGSDSGDVVVYAAESHSMVARALSNIEFKVVNGEGNVTANEIVSKLAYLLSQGVISDEDAAEQLKLVLVFALNQEELDDAERLEALAVIGDAMVEIPADQELYTPEQLQGLYGAAEAVLAKYEAYNEAADAYYAYYEEVNGRPMVATPSAIQLVLDYSNGTKVTVKLERRENGTYVYEGIKLMDGEGVGIDVKATTGSAINFTITETENGGARHVDFKQDTTMVVGDTVRGSVTADQSVSYTAVNTFDPKEEPDDTTDPTDPDDPEPPVVIPPRGDDDPYDGPYSDDPSSDDPSTEIPDADVPLAEPDMTDVTEPTEPDIEIDDPDVPLSDVPGEPVEIEDPQVPLSDAPQTGDSNNAIPFVVLMMVAGFGLVITRKRFN